MFTPKQVRNGADVGVAEHNSAIPGPDATSQVAGLQSTSEAAADARKGAGSALLSGAPADAVGGLTAGGDMWDWDSGLAVAEQPGEM